MSTSEKSLAPNASLADSLRQRIRQQGSIGFDEFMASALYDPQGGYYASSSRRTGKEADFFTSVSVGPTFGRLLAAQFAEMWKKLGRPKDFVLVEQGASDGRLMADVLSAIETDHQGFRPHAILVEPLPILRAAQKQTLQPWINRIAHVKHEDEIPPFTGVFYANELLDAFPVRLYLRKENAWFERRVVLDGESFVFHAEPISQALLPTEVASLPLPVSSDFYQVEFRPSLAQWMKSIASKLQSGWMLLVDYGHSVEERYTPERAGGTLAAYSKHQRVEDPLSNPGNIDLTAHVDFSSVERAAESAGLRTIRFVDQYHALVPLAARVFPGMRTSALSPEEAREMRALRQLLHPGSMGIAFKFLILGRDFL